MPQDLGLKRMPLRRGDIQVRTRAELTAILWRDKRDVRVLINIHDPPGAGNFCDNNGKAIKPQIVADYNCHMGYVDKGARMIFYQPSHMEVDKETSYICLTWPF